MSADSGQARTLQETWLFMSLFAATRAYPFTDRVHAIYTYFVPTHVIFVAIFNTDDLHERE